MGERNDVQDNENLTTNNAHLSFHFCFCRQSRHMLKTAILRKFPTSEHLLKDPLSNGKYIEGL